MGRPRKPLWSPDHRGFESHTFRHATAKADGAGRHGAGDTLAAVEASTLDDERGVDRRQIRELLALTPAERVDRLVRTVAVWTEILTASGSPPPRAR
jgi:hypothetical protein